MTKLALSQIGDIHYYILRNLKLDIFLNDKEDTVITKLQKYVLTLFIIGIVQTFAILQVTSYDPADPFEEKAMHWGISLNMTCFLIKFIRIISNIGLFKSLFIDFERMNCNQHRSDYAREVLTKAIDFCKKIDKNCMYFMVFIYLVWFLVPALLSPFVVLVNQEEMTYDSITSHLPTTFSFKVNSPFREIRYVFESVNCFVATALLQSANLSFFVIVYMLQTQFMVLCDSVKRRHDLTSNDDKEPLALKKLIKDHVTLLRISKNLKEFLSPLLMVQLLDSVFLIGCIGSSLTSTPTTKDASLIDVLANFVQFASFLCLALAELFMYCWLSHITNESNQKLASAIFETSDWYLNLGGKRDLVLTILLSQRDTSFRAFDMVGINLFRFLDVVRLSYSYFTMLKQFAKGEE
ncbi:uncharacterized protein LOC106665206 isoform X1 [Cimex lectularius]|uniref:Odorant receptor n=1 Tax=Cimex lectularius TaxID=79782 RepID=A0A8I6RIQ5_CIMLE|nr:uncharacterized protein LOC106665206 isoform X1 [Cimex lectularius]